MSRDRDGLEVLLPQVSTWFRSAFGAPTPPQAQGWPAIDMRTRLPIAVSPGQTRRAVSASMSATSGELSVSDSARTRPSSSGMPMAWK